MAIPHKHAGTAAVFSFIFSGLGQLYNGQVGKGLLVIAVAALSLFIHVGGAVLIYLWFMQAVGKDFLKLGIGIFVFGFVAVCAIGIYSIVDAYHVAQRHE